MPNPVESQLELLSYYLSELPDWIVGVGYGLHHLRKWAQHCFEIFGIWA
jgi:predicted alpha/beta hydrolase